MSRRMRTGLGALVVALASLGVLAAPAGASTADAVEDEATSTAESTPSTTEAPATTAPPTTDTPPSSVVDESTTTTAPAVVDETVPEEQVVEDVEETVDDEVFVEEDESFVDEPAGAPLFEGDERVTATTRLDFGAVSVPTEERTATSSVVAVEGGQANEVSDSGDVVRLVMALLVVVGLLVATLTVRYWWYTNPARGLAPSRAVFRPGTDAEPAMAALPAGPAVEQHAGGGGELDPTHLDAGAGGGPDAAEYVGAPLDGPFVEPWYDQHEYVPEGELVGARGGEAQEAVQRTPFVDYGAELDTGPHDAVLAPEAAHPPAGLWQDRQGRSWQSRVSGNSSNGHGSDAGGARTVQAADVLAWADAPSGGQASE